MQSCSKKNTNGHIREGTEGNQGLNKVSEISIQTSIMPVRLKGNFQFPLIFFFPSLVRWSCAKEEEQEGNTVGFWGGKCRELKWKEIAHKF